MYPIFSRPLTNQHASSKLAVKKWNSALIGQTRPIAIPLFSLLTVKWNSVLIGQSGVRELLPWNRRSDKNPILDSFVFSPILYSTTYFT